MHRRATRDASWPSRRLTCCCPTRIAVVIGTRVTRPGRSARGRARREAEGGRRPDDGRVRTRTPARAALPGLPGAGRPGREDPRGHRGKALKGAHATTTPPTTPRGIRLSLERDPIDGARQGGTRARAATPGPQRVCPGGRTSRVRGDRSREATRLVARAVLPTIQPGDRPTVAAARRAGHLGLRARHLALRAGHPALTPMSTVVPAARLGPAPRGATSDRATATCQAVACSGARARSTSPARRPARRLPRKRARPRKQVRPPEEPRQLVPHRVPRRRASFGRDRALPALARRFTTSRPIRPGNAPWARRGTADTTPSRRRGRRRQARQHAA